MRKFCDEPFRIRDVEFDQPQIAVAGSPAREVIREFSFIFRILRSNYLEYPASIKPRQALPQARVSAPFHS